MSDLPRMPSREQQEADAIALRMLHGAEGEPFTDSAENANITYPAEPWWRLVWQALKRMVSS